MIVTTLGHYQITNQLGRELQATERISVAVFNPYSRCFTGFIEE
jgi:hypothetical protein